MSVGTDVVGKKVPTSQGEEVEVNFRSTDGADRVRILKRGRR